VALAMSMAAVLAAATAPAALASRASIKAAVTSAEPTLKVDTQAYDAAVKTWKQNHGDVTPVTAAITKLSDDYNNLRTAISQQSAGSARVKKAQAEIVRGLDNTIVVFKKVSKAFTAKASGDSAAAKRAIENAVKPLARAAKELAAGFKALGIK
jgi:hypothetical protein